MLPGNKDFSYLYIQEVSPVALLLVDGGSITFFESAK